MRECLFVSRSQVFESYDKFVVVNTYNPNSICRTAFYQSSAFKKEPTRQIGALSFALELSRLRVLMNGRLADFPTVSKPPFALSDSYSHSPRRSHLAEAGGSTRPFQCKLLNINLSEHTAERLDRRNSYPCDSG